MSLTSPAFRLLDVCTIERDANAGAAADAWGQTPAPDWQPHLANVACRFWPTRGHETVEDGTTVTPVEDARLIVPAGTDVTEADQVASVAYGGGTGQDGPLQVRAVLVRRNHLELLLARVK